MTPSSERQQSSRGEVVVPGTAYLFQSSNSLRGDCIFYAIGQQTGLFQQLRLTWLSKYSTTRLTTYQSLKQVLCYYPEIR